MQRDKGQRGEREIAENLSRALGIDIERKLGAARDGGHDLEAGRLGGGMQEDGEAVYRAMVVPMPGECGEGPLRPMLAWRPNRGDWLAVIRLEDLAELLNDSLRWNFNQIRK